MSHQCCHWCGIKPRQWLAKGQTAGRSCLHQSHWAAGSGKAKMKNLRLWYETSAWVSTSTTSTCFSKGSVRGRWVFKQSTSAVKYTVAFLSIQDEKVTQPFVSQSPETSHEPGLWENRLLQAAGSVLLSYHTFSLRLLWLTISSCLRPVFLCSWKMPSQSLMLMPTPQCFCEIVTWCVFGNHNGRCGCMRSPFCRACKTHDVLLSMVDLKTAMCLLGPVWFGQDFNNFRFMPVFLWEQMFPKNSSLPNLWSHCVGWTQAKSKMVAVHPLNFKYFVSN